MPLTQTPSPIAAPALLAEAALLAAAPGAPPRLTVNARQAWAAASSLVQSQAGTLVLAEDGEGKVFGVLGIPPGEAARLPGRPSDAVLAHELTAAWLAYLGVPPQGRT